MKTLKQRIIAIAALTCVAMSAFTSCSDKSSSSKHAAADVGSDKDIEIVTNEDGYMVAAPFQVITPEDGKVNLNGIDINAPDPTRAATTEKSDKTTTKVITLANGEEATEIVTELDENNQPVTEYVTVTDASGQVVTEAGGQPVTEAVVVTKAVPATETVVVSDSDATEAETKPADYQSKTETKYIFWMNIDKDIDFDFEGQFVKLTFQVKADAPNGEYPITIDPDISTVAGKSLNREINVLNGCVNVGGTATPQNITSDGISVYADNVSAKPGDTVDLYFNIKNNPGVAAVMMWFSYDANALECKKVVATGDFADIAIPQVGSQK